MKVYEGTRTIDGVFVTVDLKPLEIGNSKYLISANGFEWSYEGVEPAQLALSILYDYWGDIDRALLYHQRFMSRVISKLENQWRIVGDEIDTVLHYPP